MRAIVLGICWVVLAVANATAGDYLSDLSGQWFNSLPDDTRFRLQADLVMTGDYDALIDGKFGPSTFAALKNFQSRNNEYPNGDLSDGAFRKLDEEANIAFGKLGMKLVSDDRSGVSLYLPSTLLTKRKTVDGGTSFETSDGRFVFVTMKQPRNGRDLAGLWGDVARPVGERTVTYSAVNPNYVVVSGQVNGSTYYAYYFVDGENFLGYAAYWSEAYADVGKLSAVFAASYTLPTKDLPAQTASEEGQPDSSSNPNESKVAAVAGERIGAFLLPDREPDVVALDGDLDENAPLDFIRALKKRPGAKRIVLNSDGGYVTPGLLVAHEVHIRRLETNVPKGAGCYSACAFIFFAGTPRTDDGDLGVHQIYGDKITAETTQLTLSDVLDALQEFGVRQEVISIMLRTPPSGIHTFTPKEVVELGINTEASPAADLTIGQESPGAVAPAIAAAQAALAGTAGPHSLDLGM